MFDRRSSLLIIFFSLLFFGVNFYFQKQHAGALRQWRLEQTAYYEEELERIQQDLASSPVHGITLPILTIDGHLAAGSTDAFFVLGWSSPMPEQVGAAHLATTTSHAGTPAFYQKATTQLPVANLPMEGRCTLFFSAVDVGTVPERFSGNYEEGVLTVPIAEAARLSKLLDKPSDEFQQPTGNYFVFTQAEQGAVLPVGLYNAATDDLLRLTDLSEWKPFLRTEHSLSSKPSENEAYYVLETPYQQLVFTTTGGALAEINLPFEPLNIVKEIAFDVNITDESPRNGHFPQYSYYTAPEKLGGEPVAHQEGSLGGYYPLLRRDFFESDRTVRIPPRLFAGNTVSNWPELAQLSYQVTQFDRESITFTAQQGFRKITKHYAVEKDSDNNLIPYSLTLEITVEGDARNLWVSSGTLDVEIISGSPSPAIKYRLSLNGKESTEALDLPSDSTMLPKTTPEWAANSNGFFATILQPLTRLEAGFRATAIPGDEAPSRLLSLPDIVHDFKPSSLPGYQLVLPAKPLEGSLARYRLYAGPLSTQLLKKVDFSTSTLPPHRSPDYTSTQSYHGWFTFISQPFAKLLFLLMRLFYFVTHSWGFSILLLTVALRLMLYPLNNWSFKASARMQQIAPQIQALQEKYKNDPKQLQMEMIALYRTHGVNPFSGCLPLLIQLPFLIGMFDLLKSSFELRGASFIPGWITDLAAPDLLFHWKISLPLVGNSFRLLPLLLGGVMLLQQRLMTASPNNISKPSDQQRQQQAMGTIMAVVFTLMFYNAPSGLNLYWLFSMILGIAQQKWISNQLATKSMPKKKKGQAELLLKKKK